MAPPKTALVVPTIRENSIKEFLNDWDLIGEFWDEIIVVEDNPKKSFDIRDVSHHVSWAEIVDDLGDDAWIMSRRDSSIRSYGFLMAYRLGADYIFTMDDDCRPMPVRTMDNSFVWRHMENMTNTPRWIESIPGQRTRGLPYKNKGVAKNVVMSVGLWEGNPDFDAIQTLSGESQDLVLPETRVMSLGQYVPICGMNLGFHRDITSLLYFTLQGEGYPYRRFDDIWMGVICKKICDHLGLMITIGKPYIMHSKASDPFVNLVKEAPGVKFHEEFWEMIDSVGLTKKYPASCMIELGAALEKMPDPYVSKLGRAIQIWGSYFNLPDRWADYFQSIE
jgi:reversibly glycosylated polypeptide/UDP-arabinopyranose mutase